MQYEHRVIVEMETSDFCLQTHDSASLTMAMGEPKTCTTIYM